MILHRAVSMAVLAAQMPLVPGVTQCGFVTTSGVSGGEVVARDLNGNSQILSEIHGSTKGWDDPVQLPLQPLVVLLREVGRTLEAHESEGFVLVPYVEV